MYSCYWVVSLVYKFWKKVLSDIFLKIFLSSLWPTFSFFWTVNYQRKIFQLFIVCAHVCACLSSVRRNLAYPTRKIFHYVYFMKIYNYNWFSNLFPVNFLWMSKIKVQFLVLPININFLSPFVEKTTHPTLNWLGTFDES